MTESAVETKAAKPAGRSLWQRIWERKLLYLMLLPMVVYLLIFCYYPMYGVTLAFKDFNYSLGILHSPWTKNHGFYNVSGIRTLISSILSRSRRRVRRLCFL